MDALALAAWLRQHQGGSNEVERTGRGEADGETHVAVPDGYAREDGFLAGAS